jgi:hypothetical protein
LTTPSSWRAISQLLPLRPQVRGGLGDLLARRHGKLAVLLLQLAPQIRAKVAALCPERFTNRVFQDFIMTVVLTLDLGTRVCDFILSPLPPELTFAGSEFRRHDDGLRRGASVLGRLEHQIWRGLPTKHFVHAFLLSSLLENAPLFELGSLVLKALGGIHINLTAISSLPFITNRRENDPPGHHPENSSARGPSIGSHDIISSHPAIILSQQVRIETVHEDSLLITHNCINKTRSHDLVMAESSSTSLARRE